MAKDKKARGRKKGRKAGGRQANIVQQVQVGMRALRKKAEAAVRDIEKRIQALNQEKNNIISSLGLDKVATPARKQKRARGRTDWTAILNKLPNEFDKKKFMSAAEKAGVNKTKASRQFEQFKSAKKLVVVKKVRGNPVVKKA